MPSFSSENCELENDGFITDLCWHFAAARGHADQLQDPFCPLSLFQKILSLPFRPGAFYSNLQTQISDLRTQNPIGL